MNIESGRFYSPAEVAQLLGMSKDSVRRWVREGRLPGIQPAGRRRGAKMLIRGSDVLALLEHGSTEHSK